MKNKQLIVRFISIVLCILLSSSTVCYAESEGYTEVNVQGLTMLFPYDWYVMYEGKENVEDIYTMFKIDSDESFQKYMDGVIIDAISMPDIDLSSDLGVFNNEDAIEIFLIDNTYKFQPGYKNLYEQTEEVKQAYLEECTSSLQSESGMNVDAAYFVSIGTEDSYKDFIFVNLSYMNYHYLVAVTVLEGRVFTFMSLSHDSEEILNKKQEVLVQVLSMFDVEDIAVYEAGLEGNTIDASSENIDTYETKTESTQAGEKFMENMPLGIFLILLLVILMWGLKGSKKKEFYEDAFSLKISKGIQGFCAAGIMLHHLAQTVTNNGNVDKGVINIMCNIGVLFVGIFFFCSGYGLYTSLKSKSDYFKGFFKKRLPSILVPFYVGNTIFVLTSILFGAKYTVSELVSLLTGWVLLNTQLWYIVEIFILYIVFYLLFKISKEKLGYVLIGVFVVGLIIFSLLLGHDFKTVSGGAWLHGEWWYNGIFLFFIGITFARYYDSIMKSIKKYYPIWISISLIGSGVFYALTEYMLKTKGYWAEWEGHSGYIEKVQTLACQLPMIICMVIAFFVITMKLQFNNKILDFLGKISLELYIIHNLFIVNLRNQINIENDFMYILSVYILSISMAVLLNGFDQKIIFFFTRKKISGGDVV